MSDFSTREQRLALSLLEASRTNSKITKVLELLRKRVAADDKEINDAINELLDQQDAQLKALEEFVRG